jgi:NADH-quinone oxidoreductase subunit M
VRELDRREVAALAPALALIVALGFFPQPMLDLVNPAVGEVVERVGVGDPAPPTPAEVGGGAFVPEHEAHDTEGGH